jgi:hypothetical protein
LADGALSRLAPSLATAAFIPRRPQTRTHGRAGFDRLRSNLWRGKASRTILRKKSPSAIVRCATNHLFGVRQGAAGYEPRGHPQSNLREPLAWTDARRSSIKARSSRCSCSARSCGGPKTGVANCPRRFTDARHASAGTSHRSGKRGELLAGQRDVIFYAWSQADREGHNARLPLVGHSSRTSGPSRGGP